MSSLPPLNKTPEENQVVQHAEVPELNILLCGPNPEIFSARPQNPRRIANFYKPDESQTFQNPRFSNVDECSLNQAPQTTRLDPTTTNKKLQNARFFSKLREDEKFTNSMDDKLNDYQKTRRAKSLIHENDYENNYYRPLQHRIKNQITSEKYNQYLTQKQQLISSMDRNPVPINSRRKLPPIASIKFSTEGLKLERKKFHHIKLLIMIVYILSNKLDFILEMTLSLVINLEERFLKIQEDQKLGKKSISSKCLFFFS